MKQQLAFERYLEREGLNLNDLPTELISSINKLKNTVKNMKSTERRGSKLTEESITHVKNLDRYIVKEIMDWKEENPEIASKENTDTKDNSNDMTNQAELVNKLMAELNKMYQQGIKEISYYNLKIMAPTCYSVIFKTYDPKEENGIIVGQFKLLEDSTKKQTFILKS